MCTFNKSYGRRGKNHRNALVLQMAAAAAAYTEHFGYFKPPVLILVFIKSKSHIHVLLGTYYALIYVFNTAQTLLSVPHCQQIPKKNPDFANILFRKERNEWNMQQEQQQQLEDTLNIGFVEFPECKKCGDNKKYTICMQIKRVNIPD